MQVTWTTVIKSISCQVPSGAMNVLLVKAIYGSVPVGNFCKAYDRHIHLQSFSYQSIYKVACKPSGNQSKIAGIYPTKPPQERRSNWRLLGRLGTSPPARDRYWKMTASMSRSLSANQLDLEVRVLGNRECLTTTSFVSMVFEWLAGWSSIWEGSDHGAHPMRRLVL